MGCVALMIIMYLLNLFKNKYGNEYASIFSKLASFNPLLKYKSEPEYVPEPGLDYGYAPEPVYEPEPIAEPEN